jgi:hypothetical protein
VKRSHEVSCGRKCTACPLRTLNATRHTLFLVNRLYFLSVLSYAVSFINTHSERKEIQTLRMMLKTNATFLELHTHTSRQKNSQSFVSNDPGDCCCALPLDAYWHLENNCPTIQELVCSAFSNFTRLSGSTWSCLRSARSTVVTYPLPAEHTNSNAVA